MLLPMLTGLLSVVWSLGLMGLLGVHLDPLNTTTPILVLAVAAGHAIQILKRYYEEYGRLRASGMAPREANREAVVESMVRVGPVMIVAGSSPSSPSCRWRAPAFRWCSTSASSPGAACWPRWSSR